MSVTRGEVERIAELARLRLDDEEVERLTVDMNRILEHADRLRAEEAAEAPAEAASETVPPESGLAGARSKGAVGADPLARPLVDVAPRFEQEFFVVPPPQGVQADS